LVDRYGISVSQINIYDCSKCIYNFAGKGYHYDYSHNDGGGNSVLQILLKIALKLQIGKDYDKKE
jgi:ribosomal protein L37AE/L43A